jgi:hypothetical protein
MPFGRSLSATAGAQEPFPWWFPLAFIGMWLVVSTVLALIAGHMALPSRFPPVSMSEAHAEEGGEPGVGDWPAQHGRARRDEERLAQGPLGLGAPCEALDAIGELCG